jgi:putative tricarboxylic transport membrane protein
MREQEELFDRDDRRTALATMCLGAVMVVLGVVVLVQAARLDNGGEVVGAATVPWVVGGLLFVVGALMVVRGRRDMGVWEVSDHTTPQDWKRLGALVAALLVFAVVISHLGYVVSATLLFGVTAVVLGAPARLRSFAYGWSVAAAVFLVFDVLIGISLPAGPWGF